MKKSFYALITLALLLQLGLASWSGAFAQEAIPADSAVSILPLESEMLQVANLAPNPSFEEGTVAPDGWSGVGGGAEFIWSSSEARSGSRSVCITNMTASTSGEWWNISAMIPVEGGRRYNVGAWVKGNTDRQVSVSVYPRDANGWLIGYAYNATFNNTSWTFTQASLSLPSEAIWVVLALGYNNPGGFTDTHVCFDDVVFTTILHVKPVATGTESCDSWANACELQTALSVAIPGDEIWVQGGEYKPTSGTDRGATFSLKSGVALYGGFDGTETFRDLRNWVTNVTTLSGDIGAVGNTSDNSYHVVTGSGVDGTAILDGFTITLGNAASGSGGGMYNSNSSPVLTNVTFIENTANSGGGMRNNNYSNPRLSGVTFNANHAVSGGGIYNENSSPRLITVTLEANTATWGGGMTNGESSSPILTNTMFIDNIVSSDGGGMINTSSSSPVLTDVTFSGNSADIGGGMYNENSTAELTNVTLAGNTATTEGGGMKNYSSNLRLIDVSFKDNEAGWGAGMSNQVSSPQLINAVFYGNTAAQDGGAIHNYNASSPVLINVTLAGNSANRGGGMDSWDSSGPDLTNTILWGNTAAEGAQIYKPGWGTVNVSYSLVEGGCPAGVSCDHLLSDDPQFVDAAGGDLRLQLTSPAIDAGDNSAVPSGVQTDLLGYPRFVDIASVTDAGNGTPPIVDMGAFEAQNAVYLPIMRK